MKNLKNIPFLLLAVIALLAGLFTGLERLGWTFPVSAPGLNLLHGPLMICGFLGTLISLERAVALRKFVWYLAPLFSGVGASLILFLKPLILVPQILIGLGSLIFLFIMIEIFRKQKILATGLMLIGALLWLAGNIFWLAGSIIPTVAGMWGGFLVFTIAGERLELSKFLKITAQVKTTLLISIVVLLVGIAIWTIHVYRGQQIAGLGMFMLAYWLLRNDIARHGWRKGGLSRFIAASLMSGFVWLAISGIFTFSFAGHIAGPYYDALLHTLFVGFVFSMIFGHAPIIFPTILGREILYHPAFYLHLALLHLSLIFRISSDFFVWEPGRFWGGMFNAIAIILFFLNTVLSVLRPKGKND
ncbi:MAG: hypothetical protein ACE5GL_08190 [Calditrichia bacterium]